MKPSTSFKIRLAGCLALLATVLALSATGMLSRIDAAWFDARMQLRQGAASEQESADIVLIGIDETTLAAYPEPMVLWHRHLGAAFAALARLRPKAVGIDLALPERSYDDYVPGGDAALAAGLTQIRAAAPVAIAMTVNESTGRAQAPAALFLAAAGVENNGYVLFPRDSDGVVRRFSEHLGAAREWVPTLAGTLAKQLGATPVEGLIDFARGPRFRYIPLHELALIAGDPADARRAAIAGKIVLIGTLLPYADRHRLPVSLTAWENRADAPGLALQAQALRNLIEGRMIAPQPALEAVLLVLFVAGAAFWPRRLAPALSLSVALALLLAAGSVWALDHGRDLPLAAPLAALMLGVGARAGAALMLARRERRQLIGTFGGFVSPQVLAALLEEGLDPTRPVRRQLAFLFADLRGFSELSQRLSPEAVFELLNRYYAAVTPALHAHGATIDNFRGDGVMAFIGAPRPASDPAPHAVAAARAMMDALRALNGELAAEGKPALRAGVALTLGEGVVGNIGDRRRNNYTALADAANVAAHLQSLARDYPFAILACGDMVRSGTGEWIALGERTLKDGRSVAVFGLAGSELQNSP